MMFWLSRPRSTDEPRPPIPTPKMLSLSLGAVCPNFLPKTIGMNHLLFIGNLGAGEIIVIALIVLLLFGGKKIQELMKGLGKGVRSFKEGMNNIENDIENSGTEKSNNENK